MAGQNFKREALEVERKRARPQKPSPPPSGSDAERRDAQPPPQSVLPSVAKLERFKQAIEQEGSVGKIEWKTIEGKPHGSCEHCPALARKHPVTVSFEGGVPHLTCEHEKEEPLFNYNEWLRATWTEVYYTGFNGRFYTREARSDKWLMLTEGAAMAELARLDVPKEERSQLLHAVRRHYSVDYAGPLAGYKSGIYTMLGSKVLVTRSPIIIKPEKGSWATLHKLLDNMFGSEQLSYVLGWIKRAYEALASGRHRPGPAFAMVGPINSAKSLFQKLLSKLFGGSSARPYSYMSGGTTFNADMLGAMHQIIEDEKGSPGWRTRQQIASAIKQMVANTEQRWHGKNKDAVMLEPLWRLSISLNDGPENVGVLPAMNEDMLDKIILLRVEKKEMPMPTTTPEQYKQFFKVLIQELPAFLHYLMQEWQMPDQLLVGDGASRWGMACYQNPDLLSSLNELENEAEFLRLLDMVVFVEGKREAIEQPAAWYEQQLRESHVSRQADKLLNFQGAGGTYLSRLAQKQPERVQPHRTKRRNNWIVYPPPADHVSAVQLPLITPPVPPTWGASPAEGWVTGGAE
jgi:hypothetical protein